MMVRVPPDPAFERAPIGVASTSLRSRGAAQRCRWAAPRDRRSGAVPANIVVEIHFAIVGTFARLR